MVPFAVEFEALLRHRTEVFFERFQVLCASDLPAVGGAENEIAEAKILIHEPADLLKQHRRLFEEERCACLKRFEFVLGRIRLKEDWDIGQMGLYVPGEFKSGFRVGFAAALEIDIGDNSENIV